MVRVLAAVVVGLEARVVRQKRRKAKKKTAKEVGVCGEEENPRGGGAERQ